MPKQRALSPEKHDAVSHSASGITNNVVETFESVDGYMTRGANVPSATDMWGSALDASVTMMNIPLSSTPEH